MGEGAAGGDSGPALDGASSLDGAPLGHHHSRPPGCSPAATAAVLPPLVGWHVAVWQRGQLLPRLPLAPPRLLLPWHPPLVQAQICRGGRWPTAGCSCWGNGLLLATAYTMPQ